MTTSVLPGILSVVVIAIVAGGIAYIGDRVGHQVGRKRLTLFGLRPKYTSTIVAVATGMLIAVSVTLIALLVSSEVRTAFFRIGQLSGQINLLKAQALEQQQELNRTRSANLALSLGAPIGPGMILDVNQPEDEQLRAFSTYFDQTIQAANQTAQRVGLQPDHKRSSDPQVREGLSDLLRTFHDTWSHQGEGDVPLLLLPIASQNLFRGETISFTFGSWPDKKLFSNGQPIASIDVEGGHPLAQPEYNELSGRALDTLANAGYPYPYFGSPSGFDPRSFKAAMVQLAHVHGHYRLVARAEGDLYPHTGVFFLATTVEPVRS
jgi:hypothetical protein